MFSQVPSLITHCSSPNIKSGQGVIYTTDDKTMFTIPHYSFLFPLDDWTQTQGGASQFEEAILFPPTLDSIQFSYPHHQDHGLFLQENNIALVVVSVAPDDCLSVEKWFTKTAYAKSYQTDYRTSNDNTWLVATQKNTLPMHTVAMIHKYGYHYEISLSMRDQKTAGTYNNLLEQMLNSFEVL